jgi:hypothetical protein
LAIFEELRENLFLKRFERCRIAEEAGDVEKQVLIQGLYFRWVFTQVPEVDVEAFDLEHSHPSRQATLDGG